jgi:3-hydroxyisobutyrate dehydrogenase-like beta-hydroxyacid dehydrogenase
MKPVVAIVAAGNMGAGIARRLGEHGVKTLTFLAGRSAATRERAAAAGMTAVSIDGLMEADLLLSVLPPAHALAFAEQTAFALKSARRKPVFVDCNAVSPATVRHIHAVISATGAEFVDAGIIGFPPEPGAVDPRIYACGEAAAKLAALKAFGLDVRVLEGPIGAASGLKMAFAGISKGTIAIVSAMILAAERAGGTEALREEVFGSERALMKTLSTRVPKALPKAWRWVAEMQEIAEFAREDRAAHEIWTSISALYGRLAEDLAGDRKESDVLLRFFQER